MKFSLLFVPLLLVCRIQAAEAVPGFTESDLINKYLDATRLQQTSLRGVSMEVDIDARVPKLQRQGKLHALRNISKVGKITYHMLGFNGDNSVKKEVIARYLAAEIEAQSGPDLAISPSNYKFKLKGSKRDSRGEVYVLAVTPRHKAVGLFKGEIWLDHDTFMPVRESGQFVKSPSVFLGKMQFVRVYDVQNGVAIPRQMQSSVGTRLFGPVQLNIKFTHFAKDSDETPVAVAVNAELQN